MAEVDRWATITPHQFGVQITFPVYPRRDVIAAAQANITLIHGAELPDPSGQPEVINALFKTPTILPHTTRRLHTIYLEDPGALPSLVHELSAYDEEMSNLSLPERTCIRRVVSSLETIMASEERIES